MKKKIPYGLISLLACFGAGSLRAAPEVVTCRAPGSACLEGKTVYGAGAGTHQGSVTGGGTAAPFNVVRRLSVDPTTSLNDG
ncbi:MAG: hypothetical protein NTU80_14040 [Verrucomicrobia bacterium]|nr:hypothetical protein [Verrucomicrobiota bacterium]